MKTTLLFLLSLMLSGTMFAQHNMTKQKGEHSINLSFTPQVYLNKVGSISHRDEDRGQQVIYPKNTLGYNFGIEYQRITRYGLVFSIGLQAGMQKNDVRVHYNFGYVDEEVPQLKNMTVDTQYATTLHDVGLRLMGGYRWQISSGRLKGCGLIAKVGATFKKINTPLVATSRRWMVGYPKNDTFWLKPAGYDDAYLGSGSVYGSGIHTGLNFTLGLSRNINIGFIQSVSVALDGTYGLFNVQTGYVYQTLDKYNSYTGDLINRGTYIYGAHDFALGIRFALGLWPDIKGRRS